MTNQYFRPLLIMIALAAVIVTVPYLWWSHQSAAAQAATAARDDRIRQERRAVCADMTYSLDMLSSKHDAGQPRNDVVIIRVTREDTDPDTLYCLADRVADDRPRLSAARWRLHVRDARIRTKLLAIFDMDGRNASLAWHYAWDGEE
jgi:hypothetical protein